MRFFVLASCNVSFALEKSTEWESGLVAGGEEKRHLKQLKGADSSSAAQSSASWTRGIAAVGEARGGGVEWGGVEPSVRAPCSWCECQRAFRCGGEDGAQAGAEGSGGGEKKKKNLFFQK